MKINERNGVTDPLLGGVTGETGQVAGGAPQAASPSPPADSIRVSEMARTLAKLMEKGGVAADLGTVRPERVGPLREAIESGRYRVDLQAVAQKFLEQVVGEEVVGGGHRSTL